MPAQNPIRCQSKSACEEFREAAIQNETINGRTPARPELTTSTIRPDFTETTTTPIRRNLPEGRSDPSINVQNTKMNFSVFEF